jgi:hypothetical protein
MTAECVSAKKSMVSAQTETAGEAKGLGYADGVIVHSSVVIETVRSCSLNNTRRILSRTSFLLFRGPPWIVSLDLKS